MREIKFRARTKWNNQIYDVVELSLFSQNATLAGAEHRLTTSYSSIDLMQWTGRCDVNGVEIYEGDIAKTFGLTDNLIGVIEWDCLHYSYRLKPFGWKSNELLWGLDFEVIGNIYENPELLK